MATQKIENIFVWNGEIYKIKMAAGLPNKMVVNKVAFYSLLCLFA